MEKSLGAVLPGYYADIVAVEGDPLADIDVVINNVRWVMKGGVVVVDKRTLKSSTSKEVDATPHRPCIPEPSDYDSLNRIVSYQENP